MTLRPMPLPEGLEISQEGGAVIIRRSWFSHVVWFLVLFCLAWDSSLIFWYSMMLGFAAGAPFPFKFIIMLFPIAHVAVGLGLTYFVFCLFLNKTDAILRPDTLEIKTHPLPWRGNQIIPATELVSFSVRMRVSGGEDSKTSYDVLYVNTDNREKTLVKGISKPEQAEYLSMALTRFYVPERAANEAAPWGSAS